MSKVTIKVEDLVNRKQAKSLLDFVKRSRNKQGSPTVHNIIMQWLDDQPEVMKNFAKHGVLKAYGAYALEYFLQIS